MGADLRRGRSPKAHERFKVYPTNTTKKEILEHTVICKGVFRGVGYGQEIHTKDPMGNTLKTLVKRDGVEGGGSLLTIIFANQIDWFLFTQNLASIYINSIFYISISDWYCELGWIKRGCFDCICDYGCTLRCDYEI